MLFRRCLSLVVVGLLLIGSSRAVTAQEEGPGGGQAVLGSGFTYQGRLNTGGTPITDTCDFEFGLWDAASAGAQSGLTQTVSLPVSDGYFTALLNNSAQFGASAFNGTARWLNIGVRCPDGGGSYTYLTRQALTATPYALYSIGNWGLNGNAATTVDNYLGTTSNVTLTLKVFNVVAFRLVPTGGVPNVLGGASSNATGGGARGVTIGGGQFNGANGDYATVAGGSDNVAHDDYAFVGGGFENTAIGIKAVVGGGESNYAGALYASVGGGFNNDAADMGTTIGGGQDNLAGNDFATVAGGHNNEATQFYATVAGGENNWAHANGSFVGGGSGNVASGEDSTVAGGSLNFATQDYASVGGGYNSSATDMGATVGGGQFNGAANDFATVSGGYSNTASGGYAALAGGQNNLASGQHAAVGGGITNTASSAYATVAGGRQNIASNGHATVGGGFENTASGQYATVAGGRENTASGNYSFAAGFGSTAENGGAFVWTCESCPGTSSSADNQVVMNSSGGFWFGRTGGGPTGFITTTDFISTTTGARLTLGGVWTNNSDRNAKTGFEPVDSVAILDVLMGVPVERWSYTAEAEGIRHLGPVAQDFYAAFGLGGSDTSIGTLDADGVALAAIQGLYTVVQEKDAALVQQQAAVAELQASNADLSARVAALEQGAAPTANASSVQLVLVLVVGLLAGGAIGAGAFALGRRKID